MQSHYSVHPAFRAQAPDYHPYTQWTDTIPVDLGGFSVEIGHALEAVCGVKVEFILDSWSACWTEKPARIYFRRTAHHTPCHPYHTHVHNKASPLSPCARVQRGERVPGRKHHERPRPRLHRVYTHTKGERGLSLEFTHSILSGLKTAGILTRLVRCALAPHAPPNLKPAVPPRYRFLSPLPPTASPGPHTLYSHPTRKRSYDMSSLFHAFPPTHPPSFPSYALPLLALCRITACPSCRP